MPQNRKKRPAIGQSSRKLGKTMLLPHPAAYAREQSLNWHPALAAFLAAKDNSDLLAKLVKGALSGLVSSAGRVRHR
jgi:hypothetical protein